MAKKGFSLIELLVVVAIIGILAAVGVVTYNGFINNAKMNVTESNRKQDLKAESVAEVVAESEQAAAQVEAQLIADAQQQWYDDVSQWCIAPNYPNPNPPEITIASDGTVWTEIIDECIEVWEDVDTGSGNTWN